VMNRDNGERTVAPNDDGKRQRPSVGTGHGLLPGRGKKAKAERAPAAARGREVVLRSCVMPDGGHIARSYVMVQIG
jgi:hypothetical protein